MTEPIDRAYVEIDPDLDRFDHELDSGLARAFTHLEDTVNRVADRIVDEFQGMGHRLDGIWNAVDDGAHSSMRLVELYAEEAAHDVAGDFERAVDAAEAAFNELEHQAQRQFDQIDRHARASAEGMSSRFRGGLSAIQLYGGLAVGALATGLEQISAFGLKGAASLEQVTTGFKALLGSEQAANAEIQELQKFAAETPFQFQDVAQAAQRMLAFGQSVGITRAQIIPTLTTIGDLVGVLGGTQESVNRVIFAFGQIASKGRLMQEDLLQISDALPGFNVQQAVAAYLGVSVADAQKKIASGAVDAKTGIDALLAGMKQFPGAAGAMAAQAQTLNGVFSTFKDTVQISLVNAFQPVIPQIKQTLLNITPVLGQAFDQLGPALGGALSAVLPLLASLVQGLTPILAPIITGLGQGLAAIGPSLAPLGAALGTIASSIAPVLPLVGQIIGALAQGLTPVVTALAPLFAGVASLLVAALTPLIPVITQVGQLLGTTLQPVAVALAQVFEQIGNELATSFTETLKEIAPVLPDLAKSMAELGIATAQLLVAFMPLIPPLVEILAHSELIVPALHALIVVIDILAASAQATGAAVSGIIDFFRNFGDTAQSAGDTLSSVGASITSAWDGVASFFTGLWNTIVGGFDAAVAFVQALPGRIGDALAALPGILIGQVQAAFDQMGFAVGFAIGTVIKFFMDLPANISAAMSAVVSAVSAGFTAVVAWLQALPANIASFFSQAWNTAVNLTTAGVNAVVSWVSQLPGRISSLVSAAWAQAVSLFSSGINAVVTWAAGLPGRLTSALSGVIGAVRGAFSGAVSWLVGVGADIIRGLINGISSMIGSAIDTVTGAVGSIIAGAKRALGAHSPSRVFMDLGHDTIEGYILGVENNIARARTAVAAMTGGDLAVNAVVNGGGGFSPAAGGAPPDVVTAAGPVDIAGHEYLARLIGDEVRRAVDGLTLRMVDVDRAVSYATGQRADLLRRAG